MITLSQPVKISRFNPGSIFFSIFGGSNGRADATYGDYICRAKREPDWILKNKCKMLGLHPEKDVEIVEYNDYNYVVIKSPEALFRKHPEFQKWYESLRRFPNGGLGYDYASFDFVSMRDKVGEQGDAKHLAKFLIPTWLLSINVVKF